MRELCADAAGPLAMVGLALAWPLAWRHRDRVVTWRADHYGLVDA